MEINILKCQKNNISMQKKERNLSFDIGLNHNPVMFLVLKDYPI